MSLKISHMQKVENGPETATKNGKVCVVHQRSDVIQIHTTTVVRGGGGGEVGGDEDPLKVSLY